MQSHFCTHGARRKAYPPARAQTVSFRHFLAFMHLIAILP